MIECTVFSAKDETIETSDFDFAKAEAIRLAKETGQLTILRVVANGRRRTYKFYPE